MRFENSIPILLFGIATVLSAARAEGAGLDALRYDLEPGQSFTYSTVSEFTGERGTGGTVGSCRISIVGENDNGSWRVAMFYIYSFTRNGEMIDTTAAGSDVLLFDLFPDGRRPDTRTALDDLNPFDYFPVFPATRDQRDSGWTFQERTDNTKYSFREVSPDSEAQSAAAVEYSVSSDADLIFPTERIVRFEIGEYGIPVRIDETIARRRAMPGDGYRTVMLRDTSRLDDEDLTRLQRGIAAYLRGKTKFQEALEAGPGSARDDAMADVQRIRAEIKGLKPAESVFGVSDVLQEFWHELDQVWMFDEANPELAAFIGKRAPEWEATAFDGRTWSHTDLVGKVTILDFWYRDCIWCIRAMPDVKRLAEAYAGTSVQVLGMNVDKDEADARAIIERMELSYPNLHVVYEPGGPDIPWMFGVESYPGIIVIDQAGVVRDFREGHQPELFEDISALVNDLLADERPDQQ